MTDSQSLERTFLVTCEVRPERPQADMPDIGGAFANCWVVCASAADAKRIARENLEGGGWAVIDTVRAVEKTADDLAEETEQYFEQAQIDGYVCVLHTFPASDLDVS